MRQLPVWLLELEVWPTQSFEVVEAILLPRPREVSRICNQLMLNGDAAVISVRALGVSACPFSVLTPA